MGGVCDTPLEFQSPFFVVLNKAAIAFKDQHGRSWPQLRREKHPSRMPLCPSHRALSISLPDGPGERRFHPRPSGRGGTPSVGRCSISGSLPRFWGSPLRSASRRERTPLSCVPLSLLP